MPRKRYTPEQIINSLREALQARLLGTWELQSRPTTAGEKNMAA